MGRNIKLFQKPRMFKFFVEAPYCLINQTNAKLLLAFFTEHREETGQPALVEPPYSCGIDTAHTNLKIPDHIHIHGYTRYSESYLKLQFLEFTNLHKNIFSEKRLKGNYSLKSKDELVEDEDAFLRYAVKDTLVEMRGWSSEKLEAQMAIAKKEYSYKLSSKTKKVEQNDKKKKLYDFLGEIPCHSYIDEYGKADPYELQKIIVEYALENDEEYLLNKNVLDRKSLMYLGKTGHLSKTEILEYLVGSKKI